MLGGSGTVGRFGIGLVLLMQSCTSGTSSSLPPTPGGISCTWAPTPSPGTNITYVSEGRLYATTFGVAKPICLLDNLPKSGPTQLSWGPQAERVLIGPDRAILPSGTEIAPFELGTAVSWSHPEGKSLLGVTSDGQLMKRRTIEADAVDISFLRRHDEAVYLPAGRHIVSIGLDDKGNYGIFLATNIGKDVKQLAIAEDAQRIYSLEASGNSIFFAADHGAHSDVHSLGLDFSDLQTLYTSEEKIVSFSAAHALAVQIGSCETGTKVVVAHADGQMDDAAGLSEGSSVELVGWVGEGVLVLRSRPPDCAGEADLYFAYPKLPSTAGGRTAYGNRPVLLVNDVEAAAIRVVAPPPWDLPSSITGDPPEG